MNRSDLQQLAEMRLSDAKKLLSIGGNDAGAYYIAGYVVECALKAAVAKLWADKLRELGQDPYPDFNDASFTKQNYYSHKTKELVKLAGLEATLKRDRDANEQLDENWKVVESWKEDARYTVRRSRQDAIDIVEAIDDPTEGVLQWIKRHW